MAPKNAKRSAHASKAAPAAKVTKVGKPEAAKLETVNPNVLKMSDSLLGPVISMVETSGNLPESCKMMLLATAPHSFGTVSEERHAVQARVVSMIGEVMEGSRSEMQALIDKETSAFAEVEAIRLKLDSSIEDANAKLVTAIEAADSKKAMLAETDKTTMEKQASSAEAKATQQREDAALEEAKKGKDEHETVFVDHFKALRDEELEFTAAHAHQAALLKYVQSIKLDSSLLTSLPTACTKSPSMRGPFDVMVFQELEKELTEHLRYLAETISNGSPAAAERAAAVDAAQSELAAAEEAQRVASDDVSNAEADRKEAETSLASAKDKASKFAPVYKKANEARDERVRDLEQFEKLNVACFVELRDRTSKNENAADTVAEDPTSTEVAKVDSELSTQAVVENEILAKDVPESAPAVTAEVGGA